MFCTLSARQIPRPHVYFTRPASRAWVAAASTTPQPPRRNGEQSAELGPSRCPFFRTRLIREDTESSRERLCIIHIEVCAIIFTKKGRFGHLALQLQFRGTSAAASLDAKRHSKRHIRNRGCSAADGIVWLNQQKECLGHIADSGGITGRDPDGGVNYENRRGGCSSFS